MLTYAIIVTFILGNFTGAFAFITISIKLADRAAAKKVAKEKFDAEVDKAMKLAEPTDLK